MSSSRKLHHPARTPWRCGAASLGGSCSHGDPSPSSPASLNLQYATRSCSSPNRVCTDLRHDKPPSLSPSSWLLASMLLVTVSHITLTFQGLWDAAHSKRVPPTCVIELPVRQVLLALHTQHPALPCGRTSCLLSLFPSPWRDSSSSIKHNLPGSVGRREGARVAPTCVVELPVGHQVLLALQTRHPAHVLHGQGGARCAGGARVHMIALSFTTIVAQHVATLGPTPSTLMQKIHIHARSTLLNQVSQPGYGVTRRLS